MTLEEENATLRTELAACQKSAQWWAKQHSDAVDFQVKQSLKIDELESRLAPRESEEELDARAALLLETFAEHGMLSCYEDGRETENAKMARDTAAALRSRQAPKGEAAERKCPKCGEIWTEFMEWYDGPHCDPQSGESDKGRG